MHRYSRCYYRFIIVICYYITIYIEYRCGKTTQVGMLNDYYKSSLKQVEQIRFPERKSAVGQLIDSYLQSTSNLNDQAIHLLFSSNRWEQSSNIEKKLNDECILVSMLYINCTYQ